MMIVHAQLESGNNSIRVSTARQFKRTQGFWQGGIPYGWEIDAQATAGGDKIYARAANGSKRPRRKAGEAETVDYIVRLADVEGLNAGSIAKRLTAERVPTRKDGAKWTDKTVRRILVNPTLAG